MHVRYSFAAELENVLLPVSVVDKRSTVGSGVRYAGFA